MDKNVGNLVLRLALLKSQATIKQPQDVWFPVYIESSEVLSGPSRYLLGGDIHGSDYNLRVFSWEILWSAFDCKEFSVR